MATVFRTQIGEIERDMTDAEIAEYQLAVNDVIAQTEAEAAAQAAKEAAQAKLAALGLTTDDLKALGL